MLRPSMRRTPLLATAALVALAACGDARGPLEPTATIGATAPATGNGTTGGATAPATGTSSRVAALRIFPGTLTLAAGTSAPLAVEARDARGADLAPTVTWTVDDASVATVDASGALVAVRAGRTTLRARIRTAAGDTASATSPVEVRTASAFSFEIRAMDATAAAELVGPAREAAATWARAVVGDLRDVTITIPAGGCERKGAPELDLAVDDVVVLARVDSVDGPGGVLAAAGPCVVRADGMPAVGTLVVDRADLPRLVAQGKLVNVVKHELGHVLGIGTLWGRAGAGATNTADGWRHVGARVTRTAAWFGVGVAEGIGGVPLAEAWSAGMGHWSEWALGTELMTPMLGDGASPLSLLTVDALGDLGYVTSPAGAEPFAKYGTGASATRLAGTGTRAAAEPLHETLHGATWTIGADGRLVAR